MVGKGKGKGKGKVYSVSLEVISTGSYLPPFAIFSTLERAKAYGVTMYEGYDFPGGRPRYAPSWQASESDLTDPQEWSCYLDNGHSIIISEVTVDFF
jgi:hypothetical protein